MDPLVGEEWEEERQQLNSPFQIFGEDRPHVTLRIAYSCLFTLIDMAEETLQGINIIEESASSLERLLMNAKPKRQLTRLPFFYRGCGRA